MPGASHAPIVYPDKDDVARAVQNRCRSMAPERNVQVAHPHVRPVAPSQIIAACENGKLAGEVARGTTIVRTGDLTLARVLEKWFR